MFIKEYLKQKCVDLMDTIDKIPQLKQLANGDSVEYDRIVDGSKIVITIEKKGV